MSKKLTLEFIQSKCPNLKLDEIKNLNLWGNDLEDISILANLPNLEIASLSINKIKNLEPLKDLINLKELYLRKNLIDDIKQIDYLKNLQNLKVLSLVDNPVVSLPNYKKKILEILPNLIKLDDVNIKNDNLNNKNKNQITVHKNFQNNILTEDTFKKNEKENNTNNNNNNNNNGNNKNDNKQATSHILSIRKKKGNIGGFNKYSTSKKDDITINNNLGENKLLQSMNFANFQTEFNRSQYRKKIVGKSFQTDNSPNKLLQSQVIIHSKFFEDEKDKNSSSEERKLLNQYKTQVTHDLNLGYSIKQGPYVKKSTINNNEAVFQSIKILLSTLNKPYLLEVQNEVNKLLGK